MKKVIGILLIVLALYLGYSGISLYSDSGGSVEVVGIELSAHDDDQRMTALIYIGCAIVSLIGGVYLIRSSGK